MYTDHTIRLLPRRRANWLGRAAFWLKDAIDPQTGWAQDRSGREAR